MQRVDLLHPSRAWLASAIWPPVFALQLWFFRDLGAWAIAISGALLVLSASLTFGMALRPMLVMDDRGVQRRAWPFRGGVHAWDELRWPRHRDALQVATTKVALLDLKSLDAYRVRDEAGRRLQREQVVAFVEHRFEGDRP